MKRLKDVLEKTVDATAIHIGLDDLALCTEENVSRLVNLKRVAMHTNVDNYSWTAFPKALQRESIEELDVLGVRVSDFLALKLKKLKAVINTLEFPLVLKHFPDLEELVLNIEGDILIDVSILKMTKLQTLSLSFSKGANVTFAVDDLSDLKALTSLTLENVSSSEFSAVWCTLSNLQALTLSKFEEFSEFPPQVVKLTSLIRLSLDRVGCKESSFNSDAFFDDPKPVKMPTSIALLPSLQYFNCQHCDYGDIEPLTNISSLQEIVMPFSQISALPMLSKLKKLALLTLPNAFRLRDISGLGMLSQLKALDISSSRVTTLQDLKHLVQLESLNIKGASIDDTQFTVIAALSTLDAFSTLKTIESKNLSQQAWEMLDKDSYLSKLAKDEILTICKQGKDADGQRFEQACLSLVDLKAIFKDDIEASRYGDGNDKIAYFDEALQHHAATLSEEALIHLINISFASTNLSDS